MNALKQPDRSGGSSRSGQVAMSGAAPAEVGDGVAQARAAFPPGATRPGPCPDCGHVGPRIVLCHNPVCLHSETSHVIRKGKPRGACGASSGPKGTACPCDQFIPNPETPHV